MVNMCSNPGTEVLTIGVGVVDKVSPSSKWAYTQELTQRA